MRRERGERKNNRGLENLAVETFASISEKIIPNIQKIHLIFLLLIVSSCSLFSSKEKLIKIDISNPKVVLKNTLAKMCFSGEGKGRIKFANETRSFSYESMLDKKKNMWSLAFQVPFYGDQLISLDFSNVLVKDRVKIAGNFYQRLIKENNSSREGRFHLSLLRAYLKELGAFFQYFLQRKQVGTCYVKKDVQKEDEVVGMCQIGVANSKNHSFKWRVFDNKLLITTKINERFRFGAEYFRGKGQFFNRMRFFLTDDFISTSMANSGSHVLDMNFFLKECF